MTDHTQCPGCIELQAKVNALQASLSKLRLFQADMQRSLRTLQGAPEQAEGDIDAAIEKHQQQKSGSYEGPDELDPVNDPHNRDQR